MRYSTPAGCLQAVSAPHRFVSLSIAPSSLACLGKTNRWNFVGVCESTFMRENLEFLRRTVGNSKAGHDDPKLPAGCELSNS
jgi:hypothetical protein